MPVAKPVLEINPSHPIVQRLKRRNRRARFADWSHILFDQATLAEGGQLEDPAAFVKRLNELMLALAGARRRASGRRASTDFARVPTQKSARL